MLTLTIALCSFANLYSLDLNCSQYIVTTDNCQQSLVQIEQDYIDTKYFVKVAGCQKKIKHSKINHPDIKMIRDLM